MPLHEAGLPSSSKFLFTMMSSPSALSTRRLLQLRTTRSPTVACCNQTLLLYTKRARRRSLAAASVPAVPRRWRDPAFGEMARHAFWATTTSNVCGRGSSASSQGVGRAPQGNRAVSRRVSQAGRLLFILNLRIGFDDPFKPLEAANICSRWLKSFQERVTAKDVSGITDLFIDDGWWRDFLVRLTARV
jgi:hypothetical protein